MSILNHSEVDQCIALALSEDGVHSDLTTQCCDLSLQKIKAKLIAKSETVAAGLPLIDRILSAAKINDVTYESFRKDGELLHKGDLWIEFTGSAASLLRIERTILNYLIRMCGIATATRTAVLAVQQTSCKILHTRKTAPGHRRTDIYACLQGGAHPHRRSLDDAILVKENHIRSSSSWQALFDGIAKQKSKASFVEIEVTNLTELKIALAAKPDRIMLDNFSISETKKAVDIFGSAVELESSGGINLSNILDYASTGVDYISMGAITHSAPAADLSLLFEIKS